jgi:hypothetical protein
MLAFEIIMTSILVCCVLYIIWCLRKATKYMREHQDEFNMTYPPQFEDNRAGAGNNSKMNKTN